MAENVRTLQSEPGRFVAVGAASTAIAMAFVVLLASSSFGSAPPVAFHPPYRGIGSQNFYTAGQGCGHTKGAVAFNFTTGNLSAISTSVARSCHSLLGSVGAASYFTGSWGSADAIKVRVPVSGTDNLSASWTLSWASAGSYVHSGASCPTTTFVNSYHFASRTYAYWDNSTGYRGYCYTEVYAAASISSSLEDLNTGQSWFATFRSPPALDFYSYASNTTTIGFTWYQDTTWTASGGYTISNGTYSGNYTYQNSEIGGKSCSGNTCPTSWSNSSAGMVKARVHATGLNRLDRFAFLFDVYAETYAEVGGWGHAFSTAAFNMATGGHGGRLTAITLR